MMNFTTKLDPLLIDVAQLIVSTQKASISLIKRNFTVGFHRACRIMDQLEKIGVVSPSDACNNRYVIIQNLEMSKRVISAVVESGVIIDTVSVNVKRDITRYIISIKNDIEHSDTEYFERDIAQRLCMQNVSVVISDECRCSVIDIPRWG